MAWKDIIKALRVMTAPMDKTIKLSFLYLRSMCVTTSWPRAVHRKPQQKKNRPWRGGRQECKGEREGGREGGNVRRVHESLWGG